MMKHTSVGLLAVLLAGCSVTSHLERRQSRALAEYAPRELAAPKPAEKRNYMTMRHDSTTYYIAEAVKDENGETMANFRLDEVVVVAKSRTLPQRKGKVLVDFVVKLPKELQGGCRSIVVVPHLHKAEGAVPLQEISIRGGLFSRVQDRNYWQFAQYVRLFRPDAAGRGCTRPVLLLFAGGSDPQRGQDVVADAARRGRGARRQPLRPAASRYASLPYLVDALLRRHDDALHNESHREVRRSERPQLPFVSCERHSDHRHAGRQRRAARPHRIADGGAGRTARVPCGQHRPHGLGVARGRLCAERTAGARTCGGTQTTPRQALRAAGRYAALRAVGRRRLGRADTPYRCARRGRRFSTCFARSAIPTGAKRSCDDASRSSTATSASGSIRCCGL